MGSYSLQGSSPNQELKYAPNQKTQYKIHDHALIYAEETDTDVSSRMFYSSKKLKSNINFIKNYCRYINGVREKEEKRKEERVRDNSKKLQSEAYVGYVAI